MHETHNFYVAVGPQDRIRELAEILFILDLVLLFLLHFIELLFVVFWETMIWRFSHSADFAVVIVVKTQITYFPISKIILNTNRVIPTYFLFLQIGFCALFILVLLDHRRFKADYMVL